jgi:fumarate hydratase subunit alpha
LVKSHRKRGEKVARDIEASKVTEAVRDLCVEANTELPESHPSALRRALEDEESPLGREVIERLLQNAEVARDRCIAFCQDTGYAVFFVEMGSEVRVTGGGLGEAIDEGVRQGYEEGYLRKSIVRSPIDRTNTGDNTPAVVYHEPVVGDGLKLTMLVKGAGCDNMSALKMLTPAEGVEAMKDFVVETIERPARTPALPSRSASAWADRSRRRPCSPKRPSPVRRGAEPRPGACGVGAGTAR